MSSAALANFQCHVCPELCPDRPEMFLSSLDTRRCALKSDAYGRFHTAFDEDALNCPAALSVEAALCAGRARHQSWGTALILYDVALKLIAAAGGAGCFDSSRWSHLLQLTANDIFAAHADVLTNVLLDGQGVPDHHRPVLARNLPACPVHQRLQTGQPESRTRRLAELELVAWSQEILQAGQPLWESPANGRPKVACLVPLVWPSQMPFQKAILDTYGAECDAVHFFISSTSEPNIMTAATHSVINLHAWYPHVPPDDDTFHRETGHTPKHDNFNTIVKLLHMLRWEAENSPLHEAGQWWYCRLERDTFFIPENFRYLVVSERLDASEPHYLGTRQFNDIPRFGFIYNDGGPGVCLSRKALQRLLDLLLQLPLVRSTESYPTFQQCEFAVGHREDLMLATCMRQAGVLPSAITTDDFGREWFSIRPMLDVHVHRPQSSKPSNMSQAWNFWTGRGHLYLPCIQQLQTWVVETPVSFNSFKSVSMFEEAHRILQLDPETRWSELGYDLHLSGLTRSTD